MTLDYAEKLALHGGPKAKRTPFPQAKRHGEAEKRHLSEVIDSDDIDEIAHGIGKVAHHFASRAR